MDKLAQRLTEERERHGSLRGAARAMGVATGTYEGWQRGWRKPRPEHYEAIAKFLGVEIVVILGWLGYLTEDQVKELSRATGLQVSPLVRAVA